MVFVAASHEGLLRTWAKIRGKGFAALGELTMWPWPWETTLGDAKSRKG